VTVRLRAHHLLCILTYSGRGYSPAFEANFERIIEQINQGESIELVAGPDDVCQPQLASPDCHCFSDSVQERDRLALRDLSGTVGLAIDRQRIELTSQQVQQLRAGFAARTIRSACQGCEWFDLCSAVAEQDFQAANLQPSRSGCKEYT